MIYRNKKSDELKRLGQFEYRDIYRANLGLLYHYTKLNTLWNILESDSLFARSIRFSNDFNEYITGRTIVENFIQESDKLATEEKAEILEEIQRRPIMQFMVCFCKNGDLLSQWRGYAQNNGVSIGFDFTGGWTEEEKILKHIEYFCVLNNQAYQMTGEKKCGNKYYINRKPLMFVQIPYQVNYIRKDNCCLSEEIRKILGELFEKNLECGKEELVTKLFEYIPFIKDYSFREEEEYRLIFDMNDLGCYNAHNNFLRSKKIEYTCQDNLKKPYINIEFGIPAEKKDIVKKIWVGNDASEMAEYICSACKARQLNIEVEKDSRRSGIIIGSGKNQENVLEAVETGVAAAHDMKKNSVKIWCHGHLPIREIIIGPGERQEDIKESLEYYKNTVFWLRYVDIKISKTPLRF